MNKKLKKKLKMKKKQFLSKFLHLNNIKIFKMKILINKKLKKFNNLYSNI